MRIMGLSLLNPEFPSPAGRFLLFTTKVMNRTFPSKIYLIFFLDTANLEHCQFSASYVVLDKASTAKLWEIADKQGFSSASGVLAHGDDDSDAVFAWVHSRNASGKTKVSTQFFIDNNSILPNYTTEDAYTNAANSYGGVNNVFLRPDGSIVSAGSDTNAGGGGSGGSSSGGESGGGGSVDPGTGDLEP